MWPFHHVIRVGRATKKNIPPIMFSTPTKKFNISLDFNILEKIKIFWGKKQNFGGISLLLKNWRYTIFSKWQTISMTIVEVCFVLMINFRWSYNFYFLSCPGRKWQARTEWRRTSTETRGCPSWMILHRPRFFLFIRPKSDHFLCLVTQSLSSLVELSWVATNCSLSILLHEFF